MLKRFIKWIKPSFEGQDSKAAARALSAFSLNAAACIMLFMDKIPEPNRIDAFYALLIAAASYLGLTTLQNITTHSDKKDEE